MILGQQPRVEVGAARFEWSSADCRHCSERDALQVVVLVLVGRMGLDVVVGGWSKWGVVGVVVIVVVEVACLL